MAFIMRKTATINRVLEIIQVLVVIAIVLVIGNVIVSVIMIVGTLDIIAMPLLLFSDSGKVQRQQLHREGAT